MRLKCIGGPADDSMIDCDPDRVSVLVSVAKVPDLAWEKFQLWGEDRTPVSVVHHRYTVRGVLTGGGEIYYLAPEGVSDFEALSRVLT